VKLLVLIVLGASVASAESHPSWWTYASPDATALVGIHWENVRQSPFAEAVQAELSGPTSLGFPDLSCSRQARELVISAPPLLAAEAGKFPTAEVQQQATAAGLHRATYKGVTLYLPAQATQLGIAQMSETLLIVGERKTLERSVDRSLMTVGRPFSPLLARAARFSQTADLWVVSTQLPDALASRFVPLDVDSDNFEGAVALRGGLNVEAIFDTASEQTAANVASILQKQAPGFPGIARGMHAAADSNRVIIDLAVSPEQLNAELRTPQQAAPVAPFVPAATAVVEFAKAAPAVAAPATAAAPPAPAPAPQPAPIPVPVPAKVADASPVPQVIRIVGLDDGPKEIPFPSAP
jgi:hypothetical protein